MSAFFVLLVGAVLVEEERDVRGWEVHLKHESSLWSRSLFAAPALTFVEKWVQFRYIYL